MFTALLAGCAPAARDRDSSFGLRALELQIGEDELSGLLHGGTEGRPVEIEYIDDKEWGHGTLSLSGQGSIDHPKKSYDLVAGGKVIKLSAQSQDAAFLRTRLGAAAYALLGIDAPEVEPIALFINGVYAGLYMRIERIDLSYFERRGREVSTIFAARLLRADFGPAMVADPEIGMRAVHGRFRAEEIRALARWANATASDEELSQVASAVDLPGLVRFLAANTFLANCDGFSNNLYAYLDRDDPKLRFKPWDWERILDRGCPFAAPVLATSNRLGAKLVEYAELRSQFARAIREAMSLLPPARARAVIESEASRVAGAYAADPYLGGAGFSLQEERSRLEVIVDRTSAELEGLLDQMPETGAAR
ncbi:MAG TPA: CotH kinase family protein [Bdellovibrionota bacterium]|nr:CotH kinase family protein [Bdellovibrionota bacterium]